MANTVVLKRSAVSGRNPTTSDLALGELALNTYDGNLFFKKDNGTASIVTVVTLAGTEALSNKTITASSFSGTTVAASGLVTLTNTTDASAIGTAAVVLSGGLSVAKAIYVGTNITGAGAGTSTLDGFNIDGGTY